MGKTVISAVTNLKFVNILQAHSLLDGLNIGYEIPATEDEALILNHYKNVIADCPSIIAKAIDNKTSIGDILFCFGTGDKFVCCQDTLSFSTHILDMPQGFMLPESIFAKLNFVDKFKLITQFCMADKNGMIQLPWTYLCSQQALSAAEMFDIKLTTTQFQKCQNVSSILGAKIRRSQHFKNQYGKPGNFSGLTFDFSISDLLVCIGNGKDDISPVSTTQEIEIKDFWAPPVRKKITRVTKPPSKIIDTHHPKKLNKSEIQQNQQIIESVHLEGHANMPPSVLSVLPLCSTSIEQLKSIVSFYNIELDISRRIQKAGIIDLIKSCSAYTKHLDKSLISSDVIFCFDTANIVLGTFEDLSLAQYTLKIPKTTKNLYMSQPSNILSYKDKCCIFLQKAIASVAKTDFTVPWCALTFGQKVSLVEHFCDYFPAVLSADRAGLTHGGSLWEHIMNSNAYKKQFGSFNQENLLFVGSIKSPKDVSIQMSAHQSGTVISRLEPLNSFFSRTETLPNPVITVEQLSVPMDDNHLASTASPQNY